MRTLATTLAAVALMAAAPSARAILNVEDLRIEEPERGYSGNVRFSFSGYSGNSDWQDVDAGGRLDWRSERWHLFTVANLRFAESRDVTSVDNSTLHFRAVRAMAPTWSLESFVQAEQDAFRQLRSRYLLGGGVRFEPGPPKPDQDLNFGLGAFAYEETSSAEGLEQGIRVNSYLSYSTRLETGTVFTTTTYFQPRVDEVSDLRLLEQAALSLGITENLRLELALDVVYDSDPFPGVEPTDVSYRTSFAYSF